MDQPNDAATTLAAYQAGGYEAIKEVKFQIQPHCLFTQELLLLTIENDDEPAFDLITRKPWAMHSYLKLFFTHARHTHCSKYVEKLIKLLNGELIFEVMDSDKFDLEDHLLVARIFLKGNIQSLSEMQAWPWKNTQLTEALGRLTNDV